MIEINNNQEFKDKLNQTHLVCTEKFEKICSSFQQEKENAPSKPDMPLKHKDTEMFNLQERLKFPDIPMSPQPQPPQHFPNLQPLTRQEPDKVENQVPVIGKIK